MPPGPLDTPVVAVQRDPLSASDTADAARLLQRLVSDGAALGWVEPPDERAVAALLTAVADAARSGDAALAVARLDGRLVGLGYWRRYDRPTHRPHADVEKVAVHADQQGSGVGRGLMSALIDAAVSAGVEVLTLDLRADNEPAIALYESLGFHRYGRLERFVAVGPARYDKLFYALDLRSD
jgi:ribosomal protein S18 acetylase RimI-like enzyme